MLFRSIFSTFTGTDNILSNGEISFINVEKPIRSLKKKPWVLDRTNMVFEETRITVSFVTKIPTGTVAK